MLFKHEKKLLTGKPRPFLRHLQLRPHGDRLLTSGAAFWLFAARVLVFAMASAEAVAWGYLGYLFGDGWVRWAVAAATGSAIFLVVWMIDVSLLMLDRASDEHAQRIFGEAGVSHTARTTFAVTTRIVVVVASLTITAPYLAQLVFHKDIEGWLEDQATSQIDQTRAALLAKHEQLIAEKGLEIERKRDEYEAEVAGVGQSGKYGSGPASEAIQRSLTELRREHDDLVSTRRSEIALFESLAENWSENRAFLSARYNLDLPQPSILANREALVALSSRPEHQQTELAIKAFLAFIFIGLLLLKLFEPRSTRFYLSEVLQQEYDRYLAGSFDKLLPEPERSSANKGAMTPQRLYDFLVHVWVPKRALEAKESEARARKAAAEQDIAELEQMLKKSKPVIEHARHEVERDRERWERAEKSHQQLLTAIDLVERHVAEFRNEQTTLESDQSPYDARGVAQYGTHIRSQLSEANEKLRELQHAKDHEQKKLEKTQEALAEAESALRIRKEEVRCVEEKLLEARSLLLSQELRPWPMRDDRSDWSR
jgi:flagellar biosynthesis chaperone FliJ